MRFSAGISTPSNLGIFFQRFSFNFQLFSLALPLFMARVFAADHANHILALHDSAAFTKSFH